MGARRRFVIMVLSNVFPQPEMRFWEIAQPEHGYETELEAVVEIDKYFAWLNEKHPGRPRGNQCALCIREFYFAPLPPNVAEEGDCVKGDGGDPVLCG